jgi:hypothetical protein
MKNEPMMRKLVELAREDEPPPLSREEAEALIDAALEEAERPSPARRSVRRWMVAVAGAAAIAAAALMTWFVGDAVQSTPEPTALELPSGDRLTATPGAAFRIERAEAAERLIEIDGGTMLFEVVPLETEERFLVVTPHVRVEVRGTVFSVEVERERSRVRVFAGRVDVFEGSRRTTVDADQVLVSTTRALASLEDDGPLGELGREAARHHTTRSSIDPRELPIVIGEPARAEETVAAIAEEAEPRPVRAPRGVALTEVAEAPETPEVIATEPDEVEVRGWIVRGEATRALAYADAHEGGSWRMIEAEALRASGRFQESVVEFELAASALSGSQKATAVFNAAQVSFREARNPAGAIVILDRWSATEPGAPLEERALALRVRALRAAGRTDEARAQARYYLDRFPRSGLSTWMQGLADGAAVGEPE